MDNGNRTPLLRLYYETSQLRNTNWSQLDDMIGNAFQPGSPIQLPPGYANPPTTGLVYGRGGTSIPSIAWRPVLPLAGGAMAGDIVLARDPTTAMMAVTKQYVDVVFATTGVYRGDWQVAANSPDLNTLVPAPAPGDRWMALTVDPNVPEFPPAGIPGIDPAVRISQGTWVQRNATNDAWFIVVGGQLTKFEADQYYVKQPGDTMSGGLVISMNGPLLTYHETNLINPALGGMRWIRSDFTQGWVFANDTPGRRLLVERHDLLGALVDIPFQIAEVTGIAAFASIPTAVGIPLTQDCPLDTVLYLRQDRTWVGALAALDPIYVNVIGDSMSGNLSFTDDGEGVFYFNGSATYHRLGGALTLREDSTGAQPQIEDNDGTNQRDIIDTINGDLRFVNTSGDTMTGFLFLSADPTLALHAASKNYVDTQDALRVLKSGDTMTGLLILSGDPVVPLGAATMRYVDTQDALHVLKIGDTMTGDLFLPATTPTQNLHAATKTYVDTAAAALQTDINSRVLRAGDTMLGFLFLSADPTLPLHAASKAYTDAADALRVLKSGDVMSGQLTLPATAPVGAQDATPKTYVDQAVAAANLYQGQWQVAPNTPDLNVPPNAPLNGYTWVAVTVDPNVPETAAVTIPGIGGATIFNGDTVRWNTGLAIWEHLQGSSLSIAQADLRYLQLAGGTMAAGSTLTLDADPVNAMEAATRNYVDTQDALDVKIAGSTMTGELILYGDPVNALGAATRQYVDAGGGLYLPLAGGTTTGSIYVPVSPNPTANNELAHKLYVDETVASNSLYQGIWNVASNTPDLTAITPLLNGYSWICQTVDPAVPESPPIALAGIPITTVIDSGWTIRWNGNTSIFELIRGPSLSLAAAQGYFVDISGDTMVGALHINLDTDYAPMLYLNKIDPTLVGNCGIVGQRNGLNRWSLYMASNEVEGTLNAGSDFRLLRWTDNGVTATTTFQFRRSDGYITAWPTFAVDLKIEKTYPVFNLNSTAQGNFAFVSFQRLGVGRWGAGMTNANETGANVGSDYFIQRVNDAGTTIDRPLQIIRSTGDVILTQDLETHSVLTRWGSAGVAVGTGITGTYQHRMGYSNQAGATYGHEIRTCHHGSITAQNQMQFWLWQQTDTPSTAAPSNHAFDVISNGAMVPLDGNGYWLNGGGGLYKKVGSGIILREHSGGTQPQIENNDGTSARDILDTVNGDARYFPMAGGWLNTGAAIGILQAPGNVAMYLQKNEQGNTAAPSIKWRNNRGGGRDMGYIQYVQVGTDQYYNNVQSQIEIYAGQGGWAMHRVAWSGTGSPANFNFEGDVYARGVKLTSDVARKRDIAPVDRRAALAAFDALKPVQFRWKTSRMANRLAVGGWVEGKPDPANDRLQMGFIADDLAPELLFDQEVVTRTDADGEELETSVTEIVHHYDLAAVVAILVSKIRDLEERLEARQ